MTKEQFIEKWHPTVTDTNGTHKIECDFEKDLENVLQSRSRDYIQKIGRINRIGTKINITNEAIQKIITNKRL